MVVVDLVGGTACLVVMTLGIVTEQSVISFSVVWVRSSWKSPESKAGGIPWRCIYRMAWRT